jgi:hypothetical protein
MRALPLLVAAALLTCASAQAQTVAATQRKPPLTGDPVRDIGDALKPHEAAETRNPLDLVGEKLGALSLAEFKYAAARAHASGNNVTENCWNEWVKLITIWQQPLLDGSGQPVTKPSDGPHLATDIERLSEIIRQLQPNSELSIACAPMAQAAQKDVGTLIGATLSGGALGLFKLPFAIP